MIDALWPILAPLLGYLLIGVAVGLGYAFKFRLGSVLGVLLFSLPVIYLFFAIKDGMGAIVMYGVAVLSPLLIAGIAALAYAGNLLKDKQPKKAMVIIGVFAVLWTALVLVSMIGSQVNG